MNNYQALVLLQLFYNQQLVTGSLDLYLQFQVENLNIGQFFMNGKHCLLFASY